MGIVFQSYALWPHMSVARNVAYPLEVRGIAKDEQARRASEALARVLQEYCKSALAPYKYPRWIEFRAELPKTATGKIQRFKLRAERT